MIQRIQSVYLAITIICLSLASFGMVTFSYLSDKTRYAIDAFGVTETNKADGKFINHDSFPAFLIGVALILIAIVTLMSYKDLKRQHRFGRMLFYSYFIVIASVIVMINFGSGQIAKDIIGKEMGLGFLFLVIGFPFVFLANTGINRDRKLLDSLNRLR